MNIALIIVLLIVVVGGTVMIWKEGAPSGRAPQRVPELKEPSPPES
jgi:hypothetical protein